MNILIIKLGAIGDVLRTTSILPALKNKYDNSSISWITKKESVDILKDNPYLDEIFIKEELNNTLFQGKTWDLVISLDDDKEACSLASFASTKKLCGTFLKEGTVQYTQNSSPWFDMSLSSKYGKMEADKMKASNTKTYPEILFSMLELGDHKKYPPLLIINKKCSLFAEEFAKDKIKQGEIVIGINTGAGERWQDKKLSIEKTVELINNLAKNIKATFILFGGPEEVERNKKIMKEVLVPLIDAGCNNSLREFTALINLCTLLFTSDSLSMHIGIALRKKVIAFFYPTSSAEIELYGEGKKIIGKGDSYCSYQQVCDHPPQWDNQEFIDTIIGCLK